MNMTKSHGERAHSKFSASGADRWFACPGSVGLSEGLPDKETAQSKGGTEAHEVLEKILLDGIHGRANIGRGEMWEYGLRAARFIMELWCKNRGSEILVETRIYLDFIHPEMFGTFDAAVIDHFGTLHVFDYKYGVRPVSPKDNLQMLFYSIGLAHRFQWNFKRVRLWIVQPRVRSYEGPIYWEIGILELKNQIKQFKHAVGQVEKNPHLFREGSHCFFCKAKDKCPLKKEAKYETAQLIFGKV